MIKRLVYRYRWELGVFWLMPFVAGGGAVAGVLGADEAGRAGRGAPDIPAPEREGDRVLGDGQSARVRVFVDEAGELKVMQR